MKVYCDSVVLIYFLEGKTPFKELATERLGEFWRAGATLVVSDLVRLECRLLPLRMGDAARLAEFDRLFVQPRIECASIGASVFDRATTIRANHEFKLGDALHLAAAVESQCDLFLTNDVRLSKFPDISIEVLN